MPFGTQIGKKIQEKMFGPKKPKKKGTRKQMGGKSSYMKRGKVLGIMRVKGKSYTPYVPKGKGPYLATAYTKELRYDHHGKRIPNRPIAFSRK